MAQAYGQEVDPAQRKNVRILLSCSCDRARVCQLRGLYSQLDTVPLRETHSVPLLAKTPLKTRGDLAAHILSTHFAFHLGQLSTLRRMLGRPPLFRAVLNLRIASEVKSTTRWHPFHFLSPSAGVSMARCEPAAMRDLNLERTCSLTSSSVRLLSLAKGG